MRSSYAAVFFVLFLSLDASARFYTIENLPDYPADFERAYSAAVQIDIGSDNWCSGVAISNDGYLLTNLHCLKTCFVNADGLYEDYVKSIEGDFYNIIVPRDRQGNHAACKTYFSQEDAAFNYDEPEVIWLGQGKASFDDARVTELPNNIYNKIKSKSDDFAILKFKTPYTNIPCVPLSRKPVQVGDPLWSVGFPVETSRHDGFDSNGKGRFISQGVARERIEEDPFLKTIYTDPLQWIKEGEIFNQPRFLLSSLDSMNGSSGSVVINDKSELVAVLFGKISPTAEVDNGSSAIAIRADHIYREVVGGLGLKKAQEIFHCQ